MTLRLFQPVRIRPVWYKPDAEPLSGMAVGRTQQKRRDGSWEERIEFLLDGEGDEEKRTRWYWKSEVERVK